MMNEKYTARGAQNKELTPEDKILKDFFRVLTDGAYKIEEVREAYFRLWDVFEEGPADERVTILLAHMRTAVLNGIPQNKFAQIIDAMQEVEAGAEKFDEYVESLDITEKERVMLSSIVRKKRSGVIEVFISGSRDSLAHITLEIASDVPEGVVALRLMDKIEKVMKVIPSGKRAEFYFEES